MAIYQVTDEKLEAISRTTFSEVGLKELDLQRLLKKQIEIISADTLIVAEEFGEWDKSKRRIDLLGIDKEANIVVIELKRTEDGGHMELQALRYAAMVSTLTFERLVEIYSDYIKANDLNIHAESKLLSFLGWDEKEEDEFGQSVKIVLASAEFSRELTTTVMWLNEAGLSIRCVRMHPYHSDGKILVDVQSVIPLPEIENYQVKIREKRQKERASRESTQRQAILVKVNEDIFKLVNSLSVKVFVGVNFIKVSRDLNPNSYFNEEWFTKKNIEVEVDTAIFQVVESI